MADGRDSEALGERLTRVGARIEARLSDHDVERLIVGARQRRRRRAVGRAGLAVAAAGVVVLAAVSLLRPSREGIAVDDRARSPFVTGAPAADHALRLVDGSAVTPLDPTSVLEVVRDSPQLVTLAVHRGGGRFDVVPRPQRRFVVQAGPVAVTVLGTVFRVERMRERVGVTVERGTVRVNWRADGRRQGHDSADGDGGGSSDQEILHAGDSRWFPPLQPEGTAEPDAGAPEPAVDPSPSPAPPPPARSPPIARRERRQIEADRSGGARKHADEMADETTDGLLAAADAARIAGRPEEGAALLKRLLDRYGDDPRAPLAALTLGRVLLMELGRPREAASVFAGLRARAPQGPFAEDALAREVEAWTRAGEPKQARARAEEYVRLYPHGSRIRAVKSLGGLE